VGRRGRIVGIPSGELKVERLPELPEPREWLESHQGN